MNNAEQFQSHNYDLLLLLLIINNYLLKLIIRNQGNNEACMTRASLSAYPEPETYNSPATVLIFF